MWHIYITGFSSSEHHFRVFHELAQVSCKYFNTKQVVQEESKLQGKTGKMNHLLTLSFILLGITVVHVHCGPAPPVTQLRFYKHVFKDNGYTKFYFYQRGYGNIYVNFNGAQLRNECKIYRYITNASNTIIGFWHECRVRGRNGVVIIKTAFGNIYGKNYNKMTFSY